VLRENERQRTVSPEQKAKIVAILAAHKGEAVMFRVYSQETEALTFANQISETFSSAGLIVNGANLFGGIGTGIGFGIHQEGETSPLALAIASAFRAADIPFGVVVDPKIIAEHTFIVFVGSKPKISN
jgi:hypothetical protein